jgi:hypothetical protein
MTEQRTAGTLDFEALRHAIENLDAGLLADFYAEDAEMHFVGRDAPPSSPHVLKGKQAIAEAWQRAYEGQDIEERVENEVIGEDRIACTVAAQYPDGKREFCAATLDVDERGKISRQILVQVRD